MLSSQILLGLVCIQLANLWEDFAGGLALENPGLKTVFVVPRRSSCPLKMSQVLVCSNLTISKTLLFAGI